QGPWQRYERDLAGNERICESNGKSLNYRQDISSSRQGGCKQAADQSRFRIDAVAECSEPAGISDSTEYVCRRELHPVAHASRQQRECRSWRRNAVVER